MKRATASKPKNHSASPAKPTSPDDLPVHAAPWLDWFRLQGWQPFAFQKEVWRAYLAGESGLVHATTGTGKTYAAWGGPLIEALARSESSTGSSRAEPLTVLWITPLRALAADTEESLRAPLPALNLNWIIERRTGDSPASVRARQRERLPTVLVTTPESLSLLLTRTDGQEQFANLRCIVVDEWHELLGTKRGVQTELALARLRRWKPDVRIWGMSATLGNLDQSLAVLLGNAAEKSGAAAGRIVTGHVEKVLRIRSMIPATVERFPWAGHLGIHLLQNVLAELDACRSALVFTNTRSQTEIWYQAILAARPEWAGLIALHHGSLDPDLRRWVEAGLKGGTLRCVVCTSSLDLGVDFSPVERVLQIGSPKGAARLLQRAGRSGHQPGAVSEVLCVPTHALELIEFAATRDAVQDGKIESRVPLEQSLDVLAQHLVTIALGGGFREEELLAEVRQSHAFRELSREDWEWALDFVHRGGETLRAYPDYRRVERVDDIFRVIEPQVARRHRLSIGTISSDAAMTVQYLRGSRLGTVEESFIARLRPGDVFLFAGKPVELIKIHEMRAYVRPARKSSGQVPRWAGGRMPLSTELARAVRRRLDEARQGRFEGPEMEAVRPILELQAEWSLLPAENEVLVERVQTRDGYHVFVYPFEGRLVHEGLANLFAWRLSRRQPITFSFAINDYGFELLSDRDSGIVAAIDDGLFSEVNLNDDIAASLNSAELAKRQFRDIARIAGLVFQGFPGAGKTTRQLQASTGLLFDVFREFDPNNPLLTQANREVLEVQLEAVRLRRTLARMRTAMVRHVDLVRPSPLGFPLLVDRMREKLTSEKLEDRVRRLQARLEKAAGDTNEPARGRGKRSRPAS